jgi:adenosylhomocysteine nucleosidase
VIAIFGAMEEEVKRIRKVSEVISKARSCCFILDETKMATQDVLIVLTGVGRAHAVQAVRAVLQKYPLNLIISTGFGGGLNSKTHIGDIVVYAKLLSASTKPTASPVLEPDPVLLSAALKGPSTSGFQVISGTGVTSDTVCSTIEAKKRLGDEFNADIVDMESYEIGRTAAEVSVPFLAVRAVVDSALDDLSLLVKITSKERISATKLITQVLLHPLSAGELLRYSRNARLAGTNLALFMGGFIERSGGIGIGKGK